MIKRQSKFNTYGPWVLLGVFFIICYAAFWPGIMSADATSQYLAAKSSVYSDHHPPLMSFVWRYLDMLYPGPATIFTLHMLMLYAAAAIFIYIFRASKFKWWYAIYPMIPNMLAYTALIVKDTGFTYSYLLAGAVMTYVANANNHGASSTFGSPPPSSSMRRTILLILFCITLLFYGTAVKYQAKFLLIFFCIGASYILFRCKLNWSSVLSGVAIYLVMLLAILATNSWLVPDAQESHSWQNVKLFDLSAISLELNKPLYPEFVSKNPKFDFANVKQQFKPYQVDHLVFYPYSVLKAGDTAEQRAELWNYWWQTVKAHSWVYLKIRARLFSYNLTTGPSEYTDPLGYFKNTKLAPLFSMPIMQKAISALFAAFKTMLWFLWLVPLMFMYIYLGIIKFKQSRLAPPLLMFNITSLALLTILFFFSMAACARYVFLATCLIHASHAMAYYAWRNRNHA